jgi:streptomycin 3"-adenylyltransferase
MVPQRGWNNCPSLVWRQLLGFVRGARQILGPKVVGIYLHGSLSMGGFNLRASDADLLVVTTTRIASASKRKLTQLLLKISKHPVPLEVTFLSRSQLDPWRYPTPFEFHFSEMWRRKFTVDMNGAIRELARAKDDDLALQVPLVRERGERLYGENAKRVLPEVPRAHSVAAAVKEFAWARRRSKRFPVYFVLNSCRTVAFLRTGRFYSKEEGARWALDRFPSEQRTPVRQALSAYRRGVTKLSLVRSELVDFGNWITREIRAASLIAEEVSGGSGRRVRGRRAAPLRARRLVAAFEQ